MVTEPFFVECNLTFHPVTESGVVLFLGDNAFIIGWTLTSTTVIGHRISEKVRTQTPYLMSYQTALTHCQGCI